MSDRPITGTRDIDFLRSTTKTITDREADGDIKTRATHLARFAITPGHLVDMASQNGRRGSHFQPRWIEVEWTNGRLTEVKITGPNRRKGGELGESSGHRYWWGFDTASSERRDNLPGAVAEAIAAYESAVSDAKGAFR